MGSRTGILVAASSFLLILIPVNSQNLKINVPRVLLPRATDVVTNFTLKVTDGGELGCFRWESSRTDVATVTAAPQEEGETLDCTSSAVVSALSKSDHRLTSIIWAEHVNSKERFRCDVSVDTIHSIEIVTTTLELFLEDAPEAFEIKAKDAKGDTFSSLDGLEVEWTIGNDVRNDSLFMDAHSILRIIKFSDTQYKPPTSIFAMESGGRRGFTVLVEGLQTGSAIVTATLRHQAFRSVPPTSVRIVVVANLLLQPPHDVYLLQFGSIHYSVQQIKQARSFEINMPSRQYYLELQDESLCQLDEKTTTVTCSELGDTQIVLKDRNMKETDAHHPSAAIHVVEPAYINLVVFPGRNWVLQRGGKYEIVAELYDRDSHLIYSSSNVQIRVSFPEAFFDVLHASANGSYQHVLAKKIGRTEISAQLFGVELPNGEFLEFPRAILKSQIVEIHDPIQVVPKRLLFPFQPENPQTYFASLSARGGSGNFTWTSADASVVSVDRNSGKVKTGFKEGISVVTAVDLKNSLHSDFSEILVLPVADLVILPSPREAEINTTLQLPVALRAIVPGSSEPQAFHDCRKLTLQVSLLNRLTGLVDDSIFSRGEELPTFDPQNGHCSSVSVKALKPGFVTLVISYVVGETVVASQQITIAAFNPLRNLEKDEISILTIGSSKLFNFNGGPAPWIHDPSTHRVSLHRVSLVEASKGIVTSRTVGGSALSPLKEVTCLKLGEENLLLEVGNSPSKTNPVPATSILHVKVVCAAPSRLEITPKAVRISALGLPLCPWQKDSGEPFPVLHNSQLHLDIRVFDSADRAFYNFSSLHVTWDVSDENLISVKENDGFVFPWHRDESVLNEEKSPNHKIVAVHEPTGKATITATVNGYRREAIQNIKNEHPRLDQKLKSSVHVVVVQRPKFSKASVSVFNHPANKELVSISDGSGFFHMVTSNPQLAKVNYDLKSRTVAILPQADGALVVTAYDVCTAATPIELAVTVAGLDRIELLVGDKVEIGKSIRMLVRVFDSAHKPLPSKVYSLINLAPVLSSDSVKLKEEASSVDRIYSVHGNSIGRVTVTFKGTTGDSSEISSKPMDIQVFLPLRIDPRNVTLVPTGKFQILVQGGPQPQTSVVFSIKKSHIATIDPQSGLLEASHLGSTIVVAEIVDKDPVTGLDVVYSHDEAEVHVVPFSGVRIRAAVRVLEVGTELPLVAMGLNEQETPFSFGSVHPKMRFLWNVDNSDILELRSIYSPLTGISSPENNFAVRVSALSQGTAMVRLTLEGAVGKQISGVDQLRIRVVEPLRLVGVACGATLFITPNTQAVLKTTRDGEGKMSYRVVDGEDFVQVDGQGQIFTEARLGNAVVEIVAVETDLTRSIFVDIQVKETSFLKINLISSVISQDGLSALPIGVPVRLTTTFHDELGREFFATNTQLKYRTNRNDFLHTTWSRDHNHTLIARPVKLGETVLKVWDSARPGVSDWISILGAAVIRPSEYEAGVGEIICYNCPLTSTDGRQGRWSSSSSNVFISKENGLAIAVAPGKASIFYNVSADVVSRSELTIKSVEKIRFENRFVENVLSNKIFGGILSVPVAFASTGGATCADFNVADYLEVAKKVWNFRRDLFQCGVEFDHVHPAGIVAEDVFSVASDIDSVTGQFVCVVETKSNIRHLEEALSTFQAAVLLTVRSAKGSQEPDVLKIDFLPAFFVQTPEVHLSHVQLESSLVISATPTVEKCLTVKSSDAGIVDVGNGISDSKKSNFWIFPIRLLTGPSLAIRLQAASSPHLVIECLKTEQKENIPLKIHKINLEAGRVSYQSTNGVDFWPYVIPSLVIVGLLSVAWLLWHLYQQTIQDRQYYQYLAAAGKNPALLQRTGTASGLGSGISPGRLSGLGSSSFSQQATSRTPSPTRQSFLGPSSGTLWKKENSDADLATDDDLVAPRLWSTHRVLPSATGAYRRSPN